MNMQAGSDECGAVSAEHTIMGDDMTTCQLKPGHDGPHMGVDNFERETVQFTRVVEIEPTESESTAYAWEQMLPPIGSDVRVFGVDGRYYFQGQTAQLDRVIFSDNGIEAIRLRRYEELCVAPWGRVDAIEWTVDS